jgi:S-adenosyl methyltransferase
LKWVGRRHFHLPLLSPTPRRHSLTLPDWLDWLSTKSRRAEHIRPGSAISYPTPSAHGGTTITGTSPAEPALTAPAGTPRSHLLGGSGHEPISAEPRFDPQVAHPARVYAYWLGSKDHYPADRKAAEEVAACHPQVVAGARANRAFLGRAVRYLAGSCGVGQFIDIGPGFPAPGSTHEVAQAIDPSCRVVYADCDPIVLAHARALLASAPEGTCGYIPADLRDPELILKEAARTLDFSQPAAVILAAVVHFLRDDDDPAGVVASLAGPLALGSFVAISHLTADLAPGQVAAGVDAYNSLVPAGITARSHAQVTALFGGLALVAPGVVPVSEWRPDHGPHDARADIYAGLATTGRPR